MAVDQSLSCHQALVLSGPCRRMQRLWRGGWVPACPEPSRAFPASGVINVFLSSPASPGAQLGGNGAGLLPEHHLLGARNGALPGHAATSSVKIPNHFNSLTTALCKCIRSFISAGAVAAQGLPAPVGFQHKDSPVAFLLLRC